MASIRKIKGRYYGYFYDPGRHPARKSVPLRTGLKSAAEKQLRRLEQDYAGGSYDPWVPRKYSQGQTVADAFALFLHDRSQLRPKSIEAYTSAVKGLTRRLSPGILLKHVDAGSIRPYMEDSRVAQATQRHRGLHLRVFFNWAKRKGLLDDNPFDRLELPKAQNKIAEFLTPTQLQKLLTTMSDAGGSEITWLTNLVLFAVNTGLRRGELISLTRTSVDLESNIVTVRNTKDFSTKSGHERSIPLSTDSRKILLHLLDVNSPEQNSQIFRGPYGRPLTGDYVSKRFKYFVRLAGLSESIRFHSLRHTCASWLVMRGVSIPIVQAIMGHRDFSTTIGYAHLAPDVLQASIDQAFG